MPSLDRWSTIAKPMPPDCMTRPAVPAAGCAAANVASRPMPGTAMPKQFGPISRMPCLRQTASRSALSAVPMPAVNTTSPRTPRAPQASATSVHRGRRHRDQREVRRFRQAGHIGEARDAADPVRGVRVDRVQAALVAAGPDVVEDGTADRAPPAARPDHRDGLRVEHRPEAGHVGGPFPERHGVQVFLQLLAGVVRRQRDRDRDHPVGAGAARRQPGVGEDVQHADVLAERLRGERLDPPRPRERHQVFEQQRRDAAVVHGVRDGEGDLRGFPPAAPDHLVAGDADDLGVVQREQGGVVRAGLAGDPPCLSLGGRPADAEEAQVGVVRGHRLVHRLDGGEVAGPRRP